MADSEKLSLKLFVVKATKQLAFVESDKDFVDTLFSFLTLPLGTIIRLLGNKSVLGCFSRLYESIENLDSECLATEACKNMLLKPRSAAELYCEHLKINVDDLDPKIFYRCPVDDCHLKTFKLYSLVPGALCPCGKIMNYATARKKLASVVDNRDGVFVKRGTNKFIISDDFQVMTSCTANSQALLHKIGIKHGDILEAKDVVISRDEALNLLERSLMSKTPISDVFLGTANDVVQQNTATQMAQIKVEADTTNKDSNQIALKLFLNKDNGQVLYTEASEDFINLLFSFLTFPLGSIVKLLGGSSLYCADNLYRSVESLRGNDDVDLFIKSEMCKTLLLNPKIALHFGCSNQILKIDEITKEQLTYSTGVSVTAVNPKQLDSGTEVGGRFVKGPETFMVTGDLVVTSMSLAAVVDLINRLEVPITNLEERIINLGEAEVLNLLKASLVSNNVFSNVFSINKRRNRRLLA